ncbi:MAG: inositol monophosphatase family protein [Phycisphaeraceae bacterium]|nr:inositol monophosphatase family protein [Phycisphaeraceae bacterium]
MSNNLHQKLQIAIEAARAAGSIIASARPESVRTKSGAIDLVTEVDLAAEKAIMEILRRDDPQTAVLSEESEVDVTAASRWVVDPLDGTTNFVHGYPAYSVSIALESQRGAEVAVVLDVPGDRLYHAGRDGGAFCNGNPIRVSEVETLSEALIGTGFAYDRREKADFYLKIFGAVMRQVQGLRRSGSAALDLAAVASGRLDGFWEFNLRPWDVAAGLLLVQEAGGAVGPVPGRTLGGAWVSPLLSNGRIHDELEDLLRDAVEGP